LQRRPAFVLDSGFGDRAVLSGFWRPAPWIAALKSMLADAAAYASWKAHFGHPPNGEVSYSSSLSQKCVFVT
jgi:hypothetical protein